MKGKILCVLIVALMIFGTTTAFAATYTSTTSYYGEEQVAVTTHVSGIEENTSVTYLAYSNDAFLTDPTSYIANVVYIDQADLSGAATTADFNYVTDRSNLAITKVKFGGSNGLAPTGGDIARKIVTITVDGVATGTTAYLATELDSNTITPFAVSLSGKTVTGVQVGGNDLTTAQYAVTSTGISVFGGDDVYGAGAQTVTLNVTTEAAGENSIAVLKAGRFTDSEGTKVQVLAQVIVADPATEYGIQISTDSGDTWTTYRALGKGSDGEFAIQLIDPEKADFVGAAGTVKVKAYVGSTFTAVYDVPTV